MVANEGHAKRVRFWTTMLVALFASTAAAEKPRYVEGQVWEYRTRMGDEGSLLKIQSIESNAAFAAPVYHISVVGFRFANPRVKPELPHVPVGQATLDASVTSLSTRSAVFPEFRAGIDEWRAAKGGVFTISVAEIVDLIDKQTVSAGP